MLGRNFRFICQYIIQPDLHVQSEAKVHITGNVYRHNPYIHNIGKTHLISQRLSLNMPGLNQNQRIQTLTMLARGDNVSNVSKVFICHRNTILLLRQRFQQTGRVADRRRPGRPRVTNPRTDRFITLTHLRRRFQTASSSARQYGISKHTVLRRLRQARQPIRPSRPYVGQGLIACHRAARLQWAQRHFRWGRQQWARVLFSDESGFNPSHHYGGIQVFRRRGERFADNCLFERDRFGGRSVMVWGGIMGRKKTNLIVVQGNLNVQGYINQILQPEAFTFLRRHGPAILMHDNSRPHVTRICRQFLNRNNVNVLPWPAVAPGMNPIEHIWDYLSRKVRAKGNVHSLRDLENALIQEWNNIPNVVINQTSHKVNARSACCLHQ